ncbi:MAG TPA: APC family permease [Candidatus Acidoferrales bacterium]|nr:APC family permease [Candidatus Acidoferrales bacterium]
MSNAPRGSRRGGLRNALAGGIASRSEPDLVRGFGLLQATALNMTNVVGVGPFITIPLILATMGGPQAMLGWILGALLAICDGQVWSELGAAWPGAGGSYRYLREAYGPQGFGRLMAFLFIWQFVLSGPLEIASGMIGFSGYAAYLLPGMSALGRKLLAAGVGLLALVLLYRRIALLARFTVALWAGTVATIVIVLATGLPHFDPKLAFSFPAGAFTFSRGFLMGLGSSMLIAMYDYMGYYDVCYIGDEVRDPERVIPRSILYCVLATAAAYLLMNVVLIGVVPWQQALHSHFLVSQFIERLHGRVPAILVTVTILWTAFGSVFALLLGYSRIPYAAARDGFFFSVFAKLHPTKRIPHISLLVLALVAMGAAFFPLDAVIACLITTRVLVQFVGQVLALPLLRRRLTAAERPYRMPFYPLPAVIALLGWVFVFVTSARIYIELGLLTLGLGIVVYFFRAWLIGTWPFPRRSPVHQ